MLFFNKFGQKSQFLTNLFHNFSKIMAQSSDLRLINIVVSKSNQMKSYCWFCTRLVGYDYKVSSSADILATGLIFSMST